MDHMLAATYVSIGEVQKNPHSWDRRRHSSTHTSLICSAAVNKNRSLSLTHKYSRVTRSSGTAEDSDGDKHTWSLGREEEKQKNAEEQDESDGSAPARPPRSSYSS